MFSIEIKNEHGFEKILLKDDDRQIRATVLPGCGALLHAWEIQREGNSFNVIDGYDSREDFDEHAESRGFRGSKLSPFVCRLREGTYSFNGHDYRVNGFYLGNHAIHGLLYRKKFTSVLPDARQDHASVSMKYAYRSEDPGYPFDYDCSVTWVLSDNGLLSVVTECTNRDRVVIPLQDGWHPYFRLGGTVDDWTLQFRSREMVEFDEALLPTGRLIPFETFRSPRKIGDTSLDNCFRLDAGEKGPACTLVNEANGIGVDILPDASYPYLQLYIPPHRTSIAIENLSGAPDGFHNGMGVTLLQPGTAVTFRTAYRFR